MTPPPPPPPPPPPAKGGGLNEKDGKETFMATKRVLIACGNGVATSTVVASKVKDYCADQWR